MTNNEKLFRWRQRTMNTTVYHDIEYLQLLNDVATTGWEKDDRTGTGTKSVFERHLRFDLRDGTIPILTSKKMHIPSLIHELLWYVSGSSNIKYLQDNNVRIWNEWADKNGDLGPVYGDQWRNWRHFNPITNQIEMVDQLANLIHTLRTNPTSRRMLVTAWNPGVLPSESNTPSENPALGKAALPPCHYTFLCYVRPLTIVERLKIASNAGFYVNDILSSTNAVVADILDQQNISKYELSLAVKQRSCDIFLGVPFNIAQYSMLLRMLAHVTNMTPGILDWNGTDVHLYSNHYEQAAIQLQRFDILPPSPTLSFVAPQDIKEIENFKYTDFIISNYNPLSTIKAKVAI